MILLIVIPVSLLRYSIADDPNGLLSTIKSSPSVIILLSSIKTMCSNALRSNLSGLSVESKVNVNIPLLGNCLSVYQLFGIMKGVFISYGYSSDGTNDFFSGI